MRKLCACASAVRREEGRVLRGVCMPLLEGGRRREMAVQSLLYYKLGAAMAAWSGAWQIS